MGLRHVVKFVNLLFFIQLDVLVIVKLDPRTSLQSLVNFGTKLYIFTTSVNIHCSPICMTLHDVYRVVSIC